MPALQIELTLLRFTPQRAPCPLDDPACAPIEVFILYDDIGPAILEALQNEVPTMSVLFRAYFENHPMRSAYCRVPLHFGILSQLRRGHAMELCLR